MTINLHGKDYEITEEKLQKVADLLLDSGILEEEKPSYPYVGVYENHRRGIENLVLFYGSGRYDNKTMMTITDSGDNPGWIERVFTPFSGTITYKNGKPVKTEVDE